MQHFQWHGAFAPTCAVSPASSLLTANGTATTTVTITSIAPRVASAFPSAPRLATLLPAGIALTWALWDAIGLMPFACRRKWLTMLCAAVLGPLLLLEGCGSGSTTPPGSSAGMYTVTVAGNGMSSGALSASTAATTFSVTIE
jgi:hypothetical protein